MKNKKRQDCFGDTPKIMPGIAKEFGLKFPEGVDYITWDTHPELMRKFMMATVAAWEAELAILKAKGAIREDDM